MTIEINTKDETETLRLFRKALSLGSNGIPITSEQTDHEFLEDWLTTTINALVKQAIEVEGQETVLVQKKLIDDSVKQATQESFEQLTIDVSLK